jgi:predicted RNase H-like nuclease (RuvC/YqgF family)
MTSEVSQQNALLEINWLNSQIKELTKKNTELQAIYEKNKQELENTKIELEKMQKDNSLCNKIYNKTSRESFIYYLGWKIYDSCENKTATTEQQNYCKNLYYEYIK